MSSVEIEDVLSSVRRLVAEDMRPKPLGAKAGGKSEPGKIATLILTPAQCVVKGKPPEEWVDENSKPARLTLTRAMAAPAAGLGQTDEPPKRRSRPRMTAVPGGLAKAQSHPDSTETASRRMNLSAALNAIRDAVDEELEDWEAEPEQRAVDETTWSDDEWRALSDLPKPGKTEIRPDEGDLAARRGALVAGLTDVEIGESASPQETRLKTGPVAEANGEDQPSGKPAPVSGEGDELRDMVREILREELQGLLGERMTRNMRKMVRSEIARAMTMRDL